MSKKSLFISAVIVAAALAPFGFEPKGHSIRVLSTALLFAAAAQSWNIVGGLANQISLGHAAFFGIGAYTSTLLYLKLGITPWAGMLAGAFLAVIAAIILCIPTMKLKGHYFALATLAFAEVLRVVANSWETVTGGSVGLSLPYVNPSFIDFQFASTYWYYWIILVTLCVISFVFHYISVSSLGYKLRAIRENEDAAEVSGVNSFAVKMIAATTSAAFMAACGTIFAQFNYFFDPESVFNLPGISIRVAMIAIIGGIGTVAGPILGAIFLIPLEEYATAAFSSVAGLAQLVFGCILILAVLIQPRGFMAFCSRKKKKPQNSDVGAEVGQ
ncbi:MAG: branched-chain amino acid ABC transporter permease [Desulfovibrio sp.]|jgi:branched-chain amino acid transport system permease protein|nr:branched-chain amino acid ABC transporter permease [Desulfovibrio sp.]